MTDHQNPAPEAGDEVVQPEVTEAEAPEAAESTEGQVETPPAEEGAEDAQAEEKSKSAARRERRKAQMDDLQRQADEAEKARQESEAKLARLKSQAESLTAPKQEDYADFENYQAALSAYHSVRMVDKRQAAEAEAEAKRSYEREQAVRQQQQAAAAQNWEAQKADGFEKYQDFGAVVNDPANPIFSDENADLGNMIAGSDAAADIVYHLGKNPELTQAILRMGAVDRARAVGRLEAQMAAPQANLTTSAPDPITPLKSGKSTASKDPGDMTAQEYRAWREGGGTF